MTTAHEGQTGPTVDLDPEIDEFVSIIARGSGGRSGRRGPQPSISTEKIYASALKLLDAEGIQAITARRLAAELNISTRTLYKRVPNRDVLLRNILDVHYSAMAIAVPEGVGWDKAVLSFCTALYRELTQHPHLTVLLAYDDAPVLDRFLGPLVDFTAQAGIETAMAVVCSRSLLNITVVEAIRRVRAPRPDDHASERIDRNDEVESPLSATIGWVVAGLNAQTSQTVARA